jgi:hypothetical protein
MLSRPTDFVHSATFLQSILQKEVSSPKADNHQVISGSNPKSDCRPKNKALSGKTDKGPYHIAKILGDVLPSDDGLPEKTIATLKTTMRIES